MLALDYGRARCGCAVSDPTGVLVTPIPTIQAPASRRGLSRLCALIRELGAGQVVVGLPVSLSGAGSAQTAEVREFARRLSDCVEVPVELYDERLTTRLAARTGGVAEEDSRAAAHLLESWLAARESQITSGTGGRKGELDG